MNYQTPVTALKGVGTKRAEELSQAGIQTLGDLIKMLPRRYEDRTRMGEFAGEPRDFPVTVRLKVNKKGTLRRIRRGMSLFVLPVEWTSPEGEAVKGEINWFNQPYMGQNFTPGDAYYFFGRIKKEEGQPYRMYAPKYAPEEKAEEFLTIVPIYKKTSGIGEKVYQSLIRQITDKIRSGEIKPHDLSSGEDYLPDDIKTTYHLTGLTEMLCGIHFPESKEELSHARRRLKFEEGLTIALGIERIKNRGYGTQAILNDPSVLDSFLKSLPFSLTNAQKRVLDEVVNDLASTKPMNRMVEGDVGSGKTVIAAAAALLTARAGLQTAYMAPTEILSEQHEKTFHEFLDPFGIQIVRLTGSTPSKKAKKRKDMIRSGQAQVIIGTHALIQESVDYYNLGLVITDEQHRFGVKQRGKLTNKGDCHTLVMSATPIPRSIALTLFGDLDLSVIDERPAGRKRIKTYFYTSKRLRDILSFMEKEIGEGHQAYLVCPFIEESEEMPEVHDATRVYKEIKKYAQNRFNIGLVTGKMKAEEKDREMRKFKDKKTDLLVATSVIEVGIDVPDATVMLILNADRFGLAQLHQLRGRIGRSEKQSYCFLVSDNLAPNTIERMKIIVENEDGSEIAKADYKLRGPGEYFGTHQSGYGGLKLLDPMRERKLFEDCIACAKTVYPSGDKDMMLLKEKLLKEFDQANNEISLT